MIFIIVPLDTIPLNYCYSTMGNKRSGVEAVLQTFAVCGCVMMRWVCDVGVQKEAHNLQPKPFQLTAILAMFRECSVSSHYVAIKRSHLPLTTVMATETCMKAHTCNMRVYECYTVYPNYITPE